MWWKLQHSGQVVTRYGHLSRFAKGAGNGAKVEQGQVIGYVGRRDLPPVRTCTSNTFRAASYMDPQVAMRKAEPGPPIPEAQRAAFDLQTSPLLAQLDSGNVSAGAPRWPRAEAHMTLYAGLMSGTSMDGVEAVLLEIGDATDDAIPDSRRHPHGLSRQRSRRDSRQPSPNPQACHLDELGELDAAVGDVFADAAMQLLECAGLAAQQVRAIGSHGQTLLHRPRGAACLSRCRSAMRTASPNAPAST